MKIKKILLASLIFMNGITFAATLPCQTLPKVLKNFSTQDFHTCLTKIQACPKYGPGIEPKCLQQTIANNKICQTSSILATTLQTDINQITIQSIKNFNMVGVNFLADGQTKYYIMTPKLCLIDTAVDPRTLVNNYYSKKANLVITNLSAPVYQSQKNNTDNFIAALKVSKDCVACSVIGKPKVKFSFDTAGNLTAVKLLPKNS